MAKTVLVGLSVDPAFLKDAFKLLGKRLKPGMRIGIEYTSYHLRAKASFPQDVFWKEMIKFVRSKGCEVVFLDSKTLRNKIYKRYYGKKSLTLADAKIMIPDREAVFMKRIPSCELSILGAAHAINLKEKANANLILEPVSSALHSIGLVPLTPENIVNKKEKLMRRKIIEELKKPGSNISLAELVKKSKTVKSKKSRKNKQRKKKHSAPRKRI